MRTILAVDPGPAESSYAIWNGQLVAFGTVTNSALLRQIEPAEHKACVIEMIQGYGMEVGQEVFDTCVWIGRFYERWNANAVLVYRRHVKLHLCNDSRAKDANVRQVVLDRVGAPHIVTTTIGPKGGIKKHRMPGPTHGVKGGEWQALALALTWWELEETKTAPRPSYSGLATSV